MRRLSLMIACLTILFAGTLGAQVIGPSASYVSIDATSSVTPIRDGTSMIHMLGLPLAAETYRGDAWALPNGTLVSDLNLTIGINSNSSTGATLLIEEITPQIPGMSTGEWEQTTPAATPFDVSPTQGAFDDDTIYVVHMRGDQGTSTGDYFLVFIVGDPYSSDLAIDVSSNGQPVTGDIDVNVGQTVGSLGLVFDVTNNTGWGVGVGTTISSASTAFFNEAEFGGLDVSSVSVPGGIASGAFSTAGVHTVRIHAWGVEQTSTSGGQWDFDYFSATHEFDIRVNDARIVAADSTGAFASGDMAGGDRDLGLVDVSALPSSWATITVSNTGAGDLVLSDPTLTAPFAGAGASAFELDLLAFNGRVPGGSSTSFDVRLSSSATAGVNTAWISLSHNDPSLSGDFLFEVKGEVVTAPDIEVSDSTGTIADGAGASGDRDFGQVDMGAMPAVSTITVRNAGTASLLIGGVVITGADAGDFVLDSSSMIATLAPGASTDFDVWFDAGIIGAKSATVEISHNAGADFTFDVAGVATTTATPVVTTTTLPDAKHGQSYGPVQIDAAGGAAPYTFAVESGVLPGGMTLGGGGALSGAPDATGTFDFTVRVTDSHGASSTQALSLDVLSVSVSGGGSDGGSGGCTADGGVNLGLLLLIGLVAGLGIRRFRRLE